MSLLNTTLKSLTTNDKWLAATLKSIGDAVIATSGDDIPLIVFMNEVAEKLTGWALDEAQGMPVCEVFNIINAKTRLPAVNPILRVVENGRTCGLANHTALISKDGREYIIEDSASPILGEDGKINGVVLVFRDITEKHAFEERSELLRAVVESSKDFIGIALPDGTVQYVNPAGRKLLGLDSLDQALSTRIIDYFADEEKTRVENQIMPKLYESGAWDGRVLFKNFKTGEKVPVSWNVFSIPETETGGIAAISCVSKDLREHEAREEVVVRANELIEDSKTKLEATVQALPIGVVFIEGPEFVYTFTNQAHADLFGEGKVLIGQKVGDMVLDHDRPALLNLMKSVYETGVPYFADDYRLDLRQFDGSIKEFYLKFSYQPLRTAKGEIYGIVATVIDVTDRMQSTKSLKDSEARLRAAENLLSKAVNVAKVGFFDWTIKEDEIVFSEQMNRDWGVDRQLKISEAVSLMHPDDRGRVQAAIKRSIDQRLPYLEQYRVIRENDKQMIWIEAQGEVTYDSAGEPVRFFGTSVDISDKKRGEETLQGLLDNLPIFAGLVDLDGKIMRINETAVSILDQTHDECIGVEVWKLSCYSDISEVAAIVQNAIELAAKGETQRFNIRHSAIKNGKKELMWVDLLIKPIFNHLGEVTAIVKTGFDITERLERETQLLEARTQAERANDTKSSFLANMSHEIRTPLGAIMGFTDLLKERNLDQRERNQFLDTILRNGKALTRIIDDILDLAKVESGKLEIEKIEFSFVDLIEEVIDLFSERTKSKGIYLRAQIGAHVPDRISSDPTRLRQILINLIGNAVKFTEHGGVTVSVGDPAYSADKLELRIVIKDTGLGITRAQREKLFQPFSQADNTTTRRFGGTGLGLALSRRLAVALGGDITLAEAGLNSGCSFTVSFKASAVLRRAPDKSVVQASPRDELSDLKLNGLKILVAEDAKDNQLLAMYMLTNQGATVDIANDGAEAFRMALQGQYDIVLMDIQMPEMDGYQATRALREAGFSKPVLALTAHAMAEERARTRAAGCDGHLTKPLIQADLIQAILSAVRTNSPGRSSLAF